MKLSKKDFEGTGKVLGFTLKQHVKNKSNLVSFIIFILMVMASVPIAAVLSGGQSVQPTQCGIEKVAIVNGTGLSFDTGMLKEDPYFADTEFVLLPSGTHGADDAGILAEISQSEEGYLINLIHSGDVEPSYMDTSSLNTALAMMLRSACLESVGVSEQQAEAFAMPLNTEIYTEKELRNIEELSFDAKFTIQYAYSIFVMIISIMGASFIARAIVDEKASKLVELLMVSVKPLALVLGKILAVMIYVFCYVLCIIGAYLLSKAVTGLFIDVSGVSSALSSFGFDFSVIKLSPTTIFVVLISLLLGYLTFSILSGINGACCSTMEDIQYAQLASMIAVMGGYIISCIAPAFNSQTASIIFAVLPIVSVFCAPVLYALGDIGFPMLCVSWLVQAAVVFLLALFCARVYDELLIHRGSRVKLRELFSMAKRSKKEAV